MTEHELADHLFDVAVSRARGAGRRFGEGADHDLHRMAMSAAAELVQLADPRDREARIRKAEIDLRWLVDEAIAEARSIPDYPEDKLGEQTYFPAKFRFCPCRPFC
jgi:hypothetical protein